jgi:hypothetical protein
VTGRCDERNVSASGKKSGPPYKDTHETATRDAHLFKKTFNSFRFAVYTRNKSEKSGLETGKIRMVSEGRWAAQKWHLRQFRATHYFRLLPPAVQTCLGAVVCEAQRSNHAVGTRGCFGRRSDLRKPQHPSPDM